MFSKYLVTAGAIALMASPAFAQGQRPNYDTNGDGKVTVAEYVDASVARSMERLDTNKDGTIQASERAGMPGGGGGGQGGAGGGQGGPGGGRGFGAGGMAGADANNDGNITKAELTASVQARAKTMDANSDGVLETSEMGGGRGPGGGGGRGPGGGGGRGPGGGGGGGGGGFGGGGGGFGGGGQ